MWFPSLSYKYFLIVGCFLVSIITLNSVASWANAQTQAEKLQAEIEIRNEELADIEAEIAEFEAALQEVGAEKDTLNKAIQTLNLERKKVLADINYTQNKIDNTDLQIDKLAVEIKTTAQKIEESESAIAEILRALQTTDEDTLVELLLRHENLADFWDEIESLETVKSSMLEKVEELVGLNDELGTKIDNETQKKSELLTLQNQYSGQKSVLESNKEEKDRLLQQTKNEEDEYQSMLAQKKEAREQLLKEVRDIESELQFILDPNTIPTAGTAVFRWPLDSVILTQYFGYTKFALANRGVYKNNMHNGIDLGAPTGTTIYAPLSGTIRNIGNTDAVPGCYSWGKWILIDHPNGLSTLFAHLSHIGVSPGQTISTGDIVGYVGNTGYSTGPHLHYTLYVSDAVTVKQFNEFKAVTGCGAALSPFSAVEGYLDPLDYLPPV